MSSMPGHVVLDPYSILIVTERLREQRRAGTSFPPHVSDEELAIKVVLLGAAGELRADHDL